MKAFAAIMATSFQLQKCTSLTLSLFRSPHLRGCVSASTIINKCARHKHIYLFASVQWLREWNILVMLLRSTLLCVFFSSSSFCSRSHFCVVWNSLFCIHLHSNFQLPWRVLCHNLNSSCCRCCYTPTHVHTTWARCSTCFNNQVGSECASWVYHVRASNACIATVYSEGRKADTHIRIAILTVEPHNLI